MRLLPPSTIPGRILAISVNVGEANAANLLRLAGVFDAHHVPATWGVATPAAADVVEAAVRDSVDHEIALCSAAVPATQVRQQLSASLRKFRQAGFAVSTLLSAVEPARAELESLVRLGLRLIAVVPAASSATTPVATLRFGLWRISASWQIPCSGWLSGSLGAARGRRLLDVAIRRNEPFHVTIDAAAVVEDPSAEKTLERLLRHVDRRRQQGMLSVVTLNALSQQLARPRTAATAQSILRERAA